jgi:pyruvate,water dikinase
MRGVPLREAQDAWLFGGKAVQLGAALRAGLPVPDGFGLDADFVAAVAQREGGALAALDAIYARCGERPLAVRSSAVGEDSAAASFAGQHATVLNVCSAESLRHAVVKVWESGKTESARAYRERVGAGHAVRIGVVVQMLVAADVSGVLFTCNPVTGLDELVIEASWGLGEAIVQGLVIPDRYRLAPEGQLLEAKSGFKDTAVRMHPTGHTHQETVAKPLVEAHCLGPDELAALHGLAQRCDEAFGQKHHDIEWAFQDRSLFLLQRRPVTKAAVRSL